MSYILFLLEASLHSRTSLRDVRGNKSRANPQPPDLPQDSVLEPRTDEQRNQAEAWTRSPTPMGAADSREEMDVLS